MKLSTTHKVALIGAVVGALAIIIAAVLALWKPGSPQITQSGSNNAQTTVIGSGNLLMFGPPPPDPELKRRSEILARLRNLYMLSHDGVTPQMAAGLEDPPADWSNEQLAKFGETWRVSPRK
jgi:hypothetical protein